MRQQIGDIKALILITILMIVSSISFAGQSERKPSAVNSWKSELQAFKARQFSSLTEMKKSASEFQNKLADDESVIYADKVSLRNQMYKLENLKAASFPEPKIVGFRKVPVDPANPCRGYVLEPEYK